MACLGNSKLLPSILKYNHGAFKLFTKMNKITQKSNSFTKSVGTTTVNLTTEQAVVKTSKKYEVLPTPVKSTSDRKEYRLVVLKLQ